MSAEESGIILLSLKVALLATCVGLPLATALAWFLARNEFPGKMLLNACVYMPLLLPPVATGYLLLMAFGRKGWIGGPLYDLTGFTFAFRWWGAALAAMVMTLPVVVQLIRIAFEGEDQHLQEAAQTLGASRWQSFWHVSLPLALPGVIAAAVLGFVKSLGEFGATITFVSNIPGETQSLALAINTLLQTPNGDSAALRLILISVVLAVGAVFAADAVARRLRRRLTSAP